MKQLITILLILFSITVHTQDLIVTKKGDSINAKISAEKKDKVYFHFIKENKKQSTFLTNDEIETISKNHFEEDIIIAKQQTHISKSVKTNDDKIRIGAMFGIGSRTAEVPETGLEEANDYYKGLKRGFDSHIEAIYYFNESIGVGLIFNSFSSSNKNSNLGLELEDGTFLGGLASNDFIYFIGPAYQSRYASKSKKNAFIMGMGLGLIKYKSEEQAGDRKITSKGSSFGVSFDFGYDIGISDNVSIGILANWTTGTLKKVKVNDGFETTEYKLEDEEMIGLSRISLSVGLKFAL